MALIRTQAFATLYTFSVHKRSRVAVCNWADVKLHCGHTGPLTHFLWHEATRNIATSPWMGCLFVTGLPQPLAEFSQGFLVPIYTPPVETNEM